jgi:hypothetical protein
MDDDFPEILNTSEKQAAGVKRPASKHLHVPATDAKPVEVQGCFSKTFDVSMEDGRNVIIQLRIEPLDAKPFAVAHGLLGDKVPTIEAINAPHLQQQKVWPFYMTRIPGTTWVEQEDQWKDYQQILCMKSLSSMLSKCFLPGPSDQAVGKVITDLRRCRALDREDVTPYHHIINQLIEETPQLRALPLS